MSTLLLIDDFDPLFAYADHTLWQTPNPQDHPTWWNASSDVTGSPWNQATYHYTTQPGASVSVSFTVWPALGGQTDLILDHTLTTSTTLTTGSNITLYGATGPTDANYSIALDPNSTSPYTQSYNTPNATDGRTVLFSADGLNGAKHLLEVVNWGSGLLVDLAEVVVELGGQGASLTNTTIENDSPQIKYSGDWTTQNGPNFSGGTSTYTSGSGASFEVTFEGSALYIYGDQVNDHGPYSIYINGTASENLYGRYTGRSGCGGGYAKYCEKLHGLMGFVGPLPEGQHTVTVVNDGPVGGNQTFFDLDYVQYTVPTTFPPPIASTSSTCPFTNCTSTSSSPSSGPSVSSTTSRPSGSAQGSSAPAQSSGAARPAVPAIGGAGTAGLVGVAMCLLRIAGLV